MSQVATKKSQAVRRKFLPDNMDGMGTFLFSYCVPSALLMISVFYEFANRDLWLNVPQPSSEPVSAVKAPMWPFMTRFFMELLLGVIASAWALGPRAINFWKRKTPPGPKNGVPAQMGQLMKPLQTYSNVPGSGPGSVAGSTMVQYQLAQPLLQTHHHNHHHQQQQQQQQQALPNLHHLQHQQQIVGGSSGFVSGSGHHFGGYPAVSYQTVCQAPSSYTGSMPRHYNNQGGHTSRKYYGGGGGGGKSQQQQMLVAQQQQQHLHQPHQQNLQGRKQRNSYKMTLSQSISLTGNETIL